MKAILIGATGAVGQDLLELLLQDNDITEVLVFARRALKVKHERLRVEVVDFAKPEDWADKVQGDVLFSCLGTTLKAAGSKEAQWAVDYTYQYDTAKAAAANGVKHYVLVSSASANAKSNYFYMRMKGQLEEDIKLLGFTSIQIYRPPMLIRQGTDRLGEKIGAKVISVFNSIGLLKAMKPMPTELLAQAMLKQSKKAQAGTYTYEALDIWALV